MKDIAYRILIFFAFFGALASMTNCTSDDKDDIVVQTFLEKNNGTKWVITEDDDLIYMRINDDMTKPIELWISDFDVAKGLADDDCYYYNDDLLEIEEMEILENSANKLTFTYLGNETWSFTIAGDRLKMEFTNSSGLQDATYLDKTNDDVDSFEICTEEFMFDFRL
jgi:hypothetical protein